MSALTLYIIFALATGIAAWYELYWPLISAARGFGIRNDVTCAPVLGSVVFICITTLIAPVMIVAVLVPSIGARFRAGMTDAVYKD